ncbi:hypothetical protein AB1Y20_009085 [Prymnesium parvum]|uniref:Fe2OG dioxygenase domain-containing protein n=1 Tax=Prymnesium parvum TaxID=97485 RepID=A0AB34JZD1_PRYPA
MRMSAARLGAPRPAPRAQPTNSVVRLSSEVEHHLVEWLNCADGPNPRLHNFTAAGSPAWREPPLSSLCCFPKHRRCFRAVLDGVVKVAEDPEEALSDLHVDCSNWASLNRSVSSEQQNMLTECALSCRRERSFLVGPVEPSLATFRTYYPSDEGLDKWHDLHADYYDNAEHVFSAILFMGDEQRDDTRRVGGEAGMADHLVRDPASGVPRIMRGHVVEPRAGRLILFSSGGENYNAPLSVIRGRRSTFHAWFKCACKPEEHERSYNYADEVHQHVEL